MKVIHDSSPALHFDSVGVKYKKTLKIFHNPSNWALRNVSFDVFHGETLGIIGRNGSGKSTLMKLMAGIINPDEGIKSAAVSSVQLLSLQVGFLGHLSGRENAILSGMLLGMRKKDVTSCMDQIIEFSELGEQIDDPVRTYSTGMRARLGFAVANQTNPDILLVDEALGVGDAKFREKSKAVMSARIDSDKTVVMVSHNEETIKQFCDRVIWLESGEIKKIGDAESVVNAYLET
jgi:lipopolysaccharide transport system ATP-binding protein